MSTYAPIVAVVYVVIAAIAFVLVDLRFVLMPATCASVILFGVGLAIFRRWRGILSIPWPTAQDTEGSLGVVVIDDTACPFLGYDQELLAEIHVRHFLELIACALLAGTALFVMIFVPLGWEHSAGLQISIFEAEFICFTGWIVLMANLRWFVERRFLRRSHYTIGTILGKDPGFFRRGVTYQFFDHRGERRGGRAPLGNGAKDNAVLVLYDPTDPDTNTAHEGFLFHAFRVNLIPKRRS